MYKEVSSSAEPETIIDTKAGHPAGGARRRKCLAASCTTDLLGLVAAQHPEATPQQIQQARSRPIGRQIVEPNVW